MGKIQVLDPTVSELIAAGEVIERPASIAKELLENAIDAKATAITVEIKQGGISFMRITDDGIGFEAEDVPTAFLRHATSKVHCKDDLDCISTLGFRGEALASICAVSKLEMMSKTADAPMGARIVLQAGVQQSFDQVGCPQGTTIVIRDLFYNVPARLKFLKREQTEGSAVQNIVEKIALSHPDISVKLIKDNKLVLHSPGSGNLLDAIHAVLGREFASNLAPISYSYQGVTVSGFVTKPSFSRGSRGMQHFFVNQRYVKTRTCLIALEEGYKHSIMTGKFPGCVLKIDVNADEVDVNVHPAKIEVRFVREKAVFEAVYFGVKTALSQADHLKNDSKTQTVTRRVFPEPDVPSQDQPIGEPFATMTAQSYQQTFAKAPKQATAQPRPAERQTVQSNGGLSLRSTSTPLPMHANTPSPKQSAPVQTPAPKPPVKEAVTPDVDRFAFLDATAFEKRTPAPEKPAKTMPETAEEIVESVQIKMIGELFYTYILFEANDQFVLIDKHAAHERILFEELKARITLNEGQVLLVPKQLTLTSLQIQVALQHNTDFEQFGFRFAQREHGLAILEAPVVLHQYDLVGIVEDMIENLSQHKVDFSPQKLDDLLHSMACRAAVKANDRHSLEELQALVQQVYFDRRIRHCPHGRPVGIAMTKYELEKKFGRHG